MSEELKELHWTARQRGMDAYPFEYTRHNLPLVLLFGLEDQQQPHVEPQDLELLQRGGFVIKSDLPPVTGQRVQQLTEELHRCSGDDKPWHSRAVNDQNSYYGFRIRSTGRKYVLPPRKADPPRERTGYSPPSSPSIPSTPSFVLHSPLSPLSPDAPVYPDGLMTPLWLRKHQEYIPSAQISFFNFTSDTNLNSLSDNQVKSDINQINSSLRSSGYKTRHVVVLVSDEDILDATDVEERLAAIKRATGLDSKNSLFLLPPTLSDADLSTFAGSILATLQPYCVEYYRDLTKHARRKKTRGSIPPPTVAPTKGTSQALSNLGWNIRYEFKLGIFAEFRQEMDAAGRHYNGVLDVLLSPDGVFETTASWSPRWDETRLLADCTALRLIRTMLWSNTTTLAVQTWVKYRDRMRELVDKRGKGSSNYGWEAWESRWAKVMAELVHRADLPIFQLPPTPAEPESLLNWILHVFAPPEKAIPLGERLPPWHLLHHSGYWNRLAGSHAKARKSLAHKLPFEDRTPPAQSPAALVASRHNTYDTYLCPDPHEELPSNGSVGFAHANDITHKFLCSGGDFLDRKQQRFADQCTLEQGRALMQAGSYQEAIDVLEPLWRNVRWRQEKWYEAVSELTYTLNECAVQQKHSGLIALTNWELLSDVLVPNEEKASEHRQRTEALSSETNKVEIALEEKDVISPLSVSLTFAAMEGHVADRMACQLVLKSQAHRESRPLLISAVCVELEGSITVIEVTHEASSASSADPASRVVIIDLNEKQEGTLRSSYSGTADLTLSAEQTVVLELGVIFRDAGNASVKRITATVDMPTAKLIHISPPPPAESINADWWQERASSLRLKRIPRREDGILKVLPKPPKLDVSLVDARKAYFTDETAILQVLFVNAEEETADIEVDVSVVDGSEDDLSMAWSSRIESAKPPSDEGPEGAHSQLALGAVATDEERREALRISAPSVPSDCVLQVRAIYYLASDSGTPISKSFRTQLNFVSPFEANYEFAPRMHPQPWPSYFSISDHGNGQSPGGVMTEAEASGLKQRWSLAAKIASFADEALTVTAVELVINTTHGAITAGVSSSSLDQSTLTISPQELKAVLFSIDIQKLSIEDRRASALETDLKLTWHRSAAPPKTDTTTTLRVPRLLIPQLEPRVLATSLASSSNPHLKQITYSIENPTIHFLTFDLTMEASEEFAVGGSKVGSVNVLPMSRMECGYRVLPLVKGQWMAVGLRVVDRYFNKTLRVLGAEGVREGREGAIEIWVGEENQAP